LHKNGVQISSEVIQNVFLEDGTGYDTFWGAQENYVDSATVIQNQFEGFIYELVLANFDNSQFFSTVIKSNCTGFGGCDFCRLT
jgi:hypothetical protein